MNTLLQIGQINPGLVATEVGDSPPLTELTEVLGRGATEGWGGCTRAGGLIVTAEKEGDAGE